LSQGEGRKKAGLARKKISAAVSGKKAHGPFSGKKKPKEKKKAEPNLA